MICRRQESAHSSGQQMTKKLQSAVNILENRTDIQNWMNYKTQTHFENHKRQIQSPTSSMNGSPTTVH